MYRIYFSLFLLLTIHTHAQKAAPKKRYDVAAFLYPAYAADDPRLRPLWPSGIGEWETVTTMQTRYPGHYWDRRPLWGTVNEADPAIMSMEINEATKHGVNVFMQSYALGPSMYYGAGAGMLPTAMSVVSDIIEIGRNIFARAAGGARPQRPRAAITRPMLPLEDVRSKYYLRFGVVDQPGVLGQLMTILGAHHVSIEQVVQDTKSSDPVAVVVLTHEAREGDMRAALAEIDKLNVVKTVPRVIRIAG